MDRGSAESGGERRRGDPIRRLGLLAVVVVLLVFEAGQGARGLGRIRTLCLGDIVEQYGSYNSFIIMRIDPAIAVTLVPSRVDYVLGGAAEVWRHMRVYLPRTYDDLVQGYDVIVTSDTDRTVFKPEWINWMADSVRDGGVGLLWLGFISSPHFPSWADTTVGEILPAKPADRMSISGTFPLVVLDREEPLMQALPWEDSPPLRIINTQIAKEGSDLWARVDRPENYPLMTYWRIANGSALNFAGHFPDGARPWSEGWRFFPQAMMFMVYRVAGRDLPRDASTFEVLMGAYAQSRGMDSLIDSILSWVEKFGGNTRPLYQRFAEIRAIQREADEAYLEGNWDLALEILDRVRTRQAAIRMEAMGAKDKALLWIYVIEWCTLLATFMVSALTVWNLMVRRRLYRDVGASHQGLR